jgi:hypothetical protein
MLSTNLQISVSMSILELMTSISGGSSFKCWERVSKELQMSIVLKILLCVSSLDNPSVYSMGSSKMVNLGFIMVCFIYIKI